MGIVKNLFFCFFVFLMLFLSFHSEAAFRVQKSKTASLVSNNDFLNKYILGKEVSIAGNSFSSNTIINKLKMFKPILPRYNHRVKRHYNNYGGGGDGGNTYGVLSLILGLAAPALLFSAFSFVTMGAGLVLTLFFSGLVASVLAIILGIIGVTSAIDTKALAIIGIIIGSISLLVYLFLLLLISALINGGLL